MSPQEASKQIQRAIDSVWQGTVEEEYIKQQLGQPNIAEQKLRNFKEYCRIARCNVGEAQAYLSKKLNAKEAPTVKLKTEGGALNMKETMAELTRDTKERTHEAYKPSKRQMNYVRPFFDVPCKC